MLIEYCAQKQLNPTVFLIYIFINVYFDFVKCTDKTLCTLQYNIILSKIWMNMKKKQIVNAKPKNEHMILNNFFRPLHIFPMLLGHQEALPKYLHHSWSQSIQFPEKWHICLKRGQVICAQSTIQQRPINSRRTGTVQCA